jgi:hypothetical protein
VERGGATRTYLLLPVDGWRSADYAYLKAFVYERYFRDEAPPPRDQDVIAIDGFGPYRPAQFADPAHPASARVGWPAPPEAVAGTGLFLRDGWVYARFGEAPRPTLDDRRQRELAAALRRDARLLEAAGEGLGRLERAATPPPPPPPPPPPG